MLEAQIYIFISQLQLLTDMQLKLALYLLDALPMIATNTAPYLQHVRRPTMHCDQSHSYTQKLVLVAIGFIAFAPQTVFANEPATDYPIAGLNPDQRPASAPVIYQQPDKNGDWYKNALYGVDTPYPSSLRFLEDQGSWYTPFIHRGMTGRYDIRGWHSK